MQQIAEGSVVRVGTAGLRDYYQLTKPTITLLVVITTIPSLLLAAPDANPGIALTFFTLIGTWLASSSASVFNHLVDRDVDAFMYRTKSRPIPTGKIEPRWALSLAIALGVASFIVLYQAATPAAAWIALAANVFYVVIYTMILKRRTVQNIVIGGAAGAVGPLIGWAAVTGGLAWEAWVLFGVIFLWTPPHFWALALKYKDDYASAGIPMMPGVRGEEATRRQMLFYTATLVPTVAALYFWQSAGLIYLALAGAATLYFLFLSYRLYTTRDSARNMPLFHYSCFYIFAVFGALALDRLISVVIS